MADGRHRRCMLTAGRRKVILRVLRAGHFPPVAAQQAGVKIKTLYSWLSRGAEAVEKGDHKHKYAVFAAEVDKALSAAEADYLSTIENSATGANWSRKVVSKRQVVDEKGDVHDLEDETKTYQRDWRAASWYLEHRHQHRWRPKQEEDPDAVIRVKRLILVGPDPTEVVLALPGPRTIEHDPSPVDPTPPPG